jgi:hypothetical protein
MNLRLSLALGAIAITGNLFSTSVAWADQPNMRDALRSLYAAKVSLQAATQNKGGHRVKALGLIDQAIIEIQEGIDAGR